MSKILVQSRMREVRVQTVRKYVVNEKTEEVEMVPGFRQFRNHQCYMSAEEAATIVEDRGNVVRAEREGAPWYWYPAGIPVPVPDDFGGEDFMPPLPQDHTGLVDPQVAAHAANQENEKARVLAQYKQNKAEGKPTGTVRKLDSVHEATSDKDVNRTLIGDNPEK